MKVIALQGTHDSGKTTTLKIFITSLLAKANLVAFGHKSQVQQQNSWLANRMVSNKQDLWVLIEYHEKLIGITTEGDYWPDIDSSYNTICDVMKNKGYSKKVPDVYICAIHTGNSMLNHVKSLDVNTHVVTQYAVDTVDELEFDLAQAVVLQAVLRKYAP